jgi:hypothetical protein
MSDALINLSEIGIQQDESKDLAELERGSDFLPQLRVAGLNAKFVINKKVGAGNLCLYFAADKIIDLSDTLDILVIAYRPRVSIFMSDENPINYYDTTTEKFNEGKDKALSGEKNFTAGIEYLIYVPMVKEFALFYMGSATLRRESANVKALVGKAATLKTKLISSKKYNPWYGAECFLCDSPFDIPSAVDIKACYDKYFANPVDSEVELESEEEERVR